MGVIPTIAPFLLPAMLPRLRQAEHWPIVDAIVITHFHLDHWGDLVPWVWGTMYGLGSEGPQPELWVPPGGADHLSTLGQRLGFPDMFEKTFHLSEYEPATPFRIGPISVTATRVPHYTLQTYAFRVQSNGAVLAYSGDSAPAQELVETAREADLFVCEATLLRGELDGQPHRMMERRLHHGKADPDRAGLHRQDVLEAVIGESLAVEDRAHAAQLAGARLDEALPLLADGGDCYDLSYGKAFAPFQAWAEAQGAARIADGLGMLVEQGAAAFEIWFFFFSGSSIGGGGGR